MGFQQRAKSDDKVVQATENLDETLRDHVCLLIQDLDLLDKSGVRQHFRFVANRYDVAKAPWEDIIDTLSEMLPSYIELYNCMDKFVEAFNHQEYASHFRMTPEWGDIIKVSHQSNLLSMALLKLFSPDARKLNNTISERSSLKDA